MPVTTSCMTHKWSDMPKAKQQQLVTMPGMGFYNRHMCIINFQSLIALILDVSRI